MPPRSLDQVHGHRSWDLQVRNEYTEDGRLHRHRVSGPSGTARYTSWDHNTSFHMHRLPNGSWTGARFDSNPHRQLPAVVQ